MTLLLSLVAFSRLVGRFCGRRLDFCDRGRRRLATTLRRRFVCFGMAAVVGVLLMLEAGVLLCRRRTVGSAGM